MDLKRITSSWPSNALPSTTSTLQQVTWSSDTQVFSNSSIKDMVTSWVQYPSLNYGCLLSSQATGVYEMKCYASEYSVSDSRPKLTVNYFVDHVGPVGREDGEYITGLVINGGDEYTNSINVTLNIAAIDSGDNGSPGVGVTHMQICNDSPNFTGATWIPYNTTTAWTLSGTDGTKSVYIRFKDLLGNITANGFHNVDSIILHTDTEVPTGSVSINYGNLTTYSPDVTLDINASDTGLYYSGVTEMQICNDSPDFTGATWIPYETDKAWTLSSTDGTKTVYVRFKDAVGNITPANQYATDSINLVTYTGPLSFSPPEGAYSYSQAVTINYADASVYYTTDKTEALEANDVNSNWRLYDPTGVVVISSDDFPVRLLARAYNAAGVKIGERCAWYWMKRSPEIPQYTFRCKRSNAITVTRELYGVRVTKISKSGGIRIEWNGNFDEYAVDRINPGGVVTPICERTSLHYAVDLDNDPEHPLDPNVNYVYQVRGLSGSNTRSDLTTVIPLDAKPGEIFQPTVWVASDEESIEENEINVTTVKVVPTVNQAVDSRLDNRYVEQVPVNYNFKNSVYKGGLFTGNATDPSRVGRSLLKFQLATPPSGLPWTGGSFNAYCTAGFGSTTTQSVGYQFVNNDNWTADDLDWSKMVALVGASASLQEPVAASVDNWSSWYNLFPQVLSEMYDSPNQIMSLMLASTDESDESDNTGWLYFAKKEFDATLAPHLFYAYGAPIVPVEIVLSNSSVIGGNTLVGTVVLNAPGATETNIQFRSTDTHVYLPNIPVPAGARSVNFKISTAIVSADTVVSLTAYTANDQDRFVYASDSVVLTVLAGN